MKTERASDLQHNADHSLQHLLSIKGLSREELTAILKHAQDFLDPKQQYNNQLLRHKTVANLFFESSTRTRVSFELAAKRLGAEVVNLDIQSSSMKKGESLFDTIHTLEAMDIDLFVIRHSDDNACHLIANHLTRKTKIINAGTGITDHPTQALLDMLTILQHKGSFHNLRVAIVGDIKHSRVARSDLYALKTLGVDDIRLIAPTAFISDDLGDDFKYFADLKTGLQDVDVIITLRIQHERIQDADFLDPASYHQRYGIHLESLGYAKKDVIVMHPGPINRGVEITPEVADGPQSVILSQVHNGVAVRMAVMALLLGSGTGRV